MKTKLNKKHIQNTILFIFFTGIMLYLLLQTNIKELIRDVAKQAWIFFAMLTLKFGQENIWKPMMLGMAASEVESESKSDDLDEI